MVRYSEKLRGMKMKIRVLHRSSIPGASWCVAQGWEPSNQIEGSEYLDGSWWSDQEQTAGMIYFGAGEEGSAIEVDIDDLRIAATGNCRVIGEVEV